jgi:hypothetical protein
MGATTAIKGIERAPTALNGRLLSWEIGVSAGGAAGPKGVDTEVVVQRRSTASNRRSTGMNGVEKATTLPSLLP